MVCMSPRLLLQEGVSNKHGDSSSLVRVVLRDKTVPKFLSSNFPCIYLNSETVYLEIASDPIG